MNNLDDDLSNAFGGATARPPWNEIERRAAGIRRRRQRTRVVAAVGVLALAFGIGAVVRQDDPRTGIGEVADPAPSEPDDQVEPPPVISPAASPAEVFEQCPPPPPTPERPIEEVIAEIAATLVEVDQTGLAQVAYAPDCDVVAYVSAAEFTVIDATPHPDLMVFDEAGDHIGWLVFGLPVLTIEAYEDDPEGHRQRGLDRMQELTEGTGTGSP